VEISRQAFVEQLAISIQVHTLPLLHRRSTVPPAHIGRSERLLHGDVRRRPVAAGHYFDVIHTFAQLSYPFLEHEYTDEEYILLLSVREIVHLDHKLT
jgi:hypothetical protein